MKICLDLELMILEQCLLDEKISKDYIYLAGHLSHFSLEFENIL